MKEKKNLETFSYFELEKFKCQFEYLFSATSIRIVMKSFLFNNLVCALTKR